MKKNTVKNLVIGSIIFLGVSYVIENYTATKKREQIIKASHDRINNAKPSLTSEIVERKYYELATITLDKEEKKVR